MLVGSVFLQGFDFYFEEKKSYLHEPTSAVKQVASAASERALAQLDSRLSYSSYVVLKFHSTMTATE